MSYAANTVDGKYLLQVRTKHWENSDSPHELVLTLNSVTSPTEHRLEVFSDESLAQEAAMLFLDCYEIAIELHYEFKNDAFVHVRGYAVDVSEVFAIDESERFVGVDGFQKELYLATIAH